MFPYTVVNSIVNHPQWGDVEHDRHDPQAWSIFRSLEAVHRRWDVATMAMDSARQPFQGEELPPMRRTALELMKCLG